MLAPIVTPSNVGRSSAPSHEATSDVYYRLVNYLDGR